MRLTPLGEMHLTYVGPSLDFVDYGVGGQYYASLEGSWRSDRITGRLRLTNIAQKRADNVNTPTLRGVMETEDGATLFVEMNGLSQIQQGGRVFVSSLTLRTAHQRYQWVNTLFGVVEGELHGPPRPNEFRVHCRVFACDATITPGEGGDGSMELIAYVMPVLPGKEGALQSFVREMGSRSSEFDDSRRQLGITREAAFLQRTPHGSQIIMYREVARLSGTQPTAQSKFEAWMKDRISVVSGFDPAVEPSPKVELLLRQRPVHRGDLYAAALPLLPGKTAHLHEWTSEINGIHAAEFEESLRRLGFGVTLFVQYTPQLDLAISVVEGDDPSSALTKLVASQHPFDRWHAQQIADQSGLDFAGPLPQPNELLWSWDNVAAHARAT